jgi:dolichyl-phosphate-mannose-protein mannosyltransferase
VSSDPGDLSVTVEAVRSPAAPPPGAPGTRTAPRRAHAAHRPRAAATRPSARAGTSWLAKPGAGRIATGVAVVAALGGLAVRLWFVFHYPSTADEDVAGLIAQAGLHGHFQAFYGGQAYGGTAEPYLISLAFAVFGQTAVVAELVLVALAAVSSLLVWRIVLRIVGNRQVAMLAGALAWCAPASTIRVSTYVYGFRGVTLVCGLAVVLLALRVLDGRPSLPDLGLLGLLAGIGWWSSPEIAYFAAPTLILLVLAVVRSPSPRWRAWLLPAALSVATFALGALPWIWANAKSGFASLSTASPGLVTHVPYRGRVSIFFHYVLSMDLGLRRLEDGARTLGPATPFVLGLCLLFLGICLLLCILRGGASLALAAGVLTFPFVYALSPFAWGWGDGRYGFYLPPLLAMVAAIGLTEAARRFRLPSGTTAFGLSAVVLLAFGLSVVGVHEFDQLTPNSFTSTWGNPDDATQAAVARLERAGVRTAYADYWVAYKLDFYGKGGLTVTTAGYDTDRFASIDDAVRRSVRPAWLFVPNAEAVRDGIQFSAPSLAVGPDTETESAFTARLDALGVPYRVVDTGVLTAIIPARAVTPFEARLPGAPAP